MENVGFRPKVIEDIMYLIRPIIVVPFFLLWLLLGNYMWLGFRGVSGYAAFASPLISPADNYCSLTFYYMLNHLGHASMTIFTEETLSKNLTTLWSAGESLSKWKKKVLSLPSISSNYSVVFLGFVQSGRHYILVDDIHFTTCDVCEFSIFLFFFFSFCNAFASMFVSFFGDI